MSPRPPVSRRSDPPAPGKPRTGDLLTLGRRIRHFRTARSLTLDQLAQATGSAASQLSLIENGHREPRLSLLQEIAAALDVELADLLAAEPPNRRAALEIALDRAQRTSLYTGLGLPAVRPGRSVPTEALEALVGLHDELARRVNESIATPEEARRANTELRLWMRERDNCMPEIDEVGERMARAAGYTVGALTHRAVARMAEQLGFKILHVSDLPHSTRTVTDLASGRIYLPPASIPGGHGLRSLALQAIAHRVLGHVRPESYADFLRQRLEITYFAAACLMPRSAALEHLGAAKRAKDLAIEDFRDAFGVTHEAAAHRFTNLATSGLDLPVHFLRVDDAGALTRGYENDGVGFATDPTGAIEGQHVCRHWAARAALTSRDRTTEYHQYTDTPAGTFWCTAQTGTADSGEFSITVGVPFAHAKWFRGRDTTLRTTSRCPDAACCRRPDPELATRWADQSWPSARMHAQVLAPLPQGTFPGVDDAEVYAFLDRHSNTR
ncbi:helix-turn-helix domain-containing protein [Cellulomonas cellasea]|uniref:helix-turn-helix transcriptional regulator n=1 Tax=Cellulomonas cellasea TaxID=43670 RepID=UPI0025A31495|nr:helix-turn-helix transcriptional regulator [Cellulomonas cellasea]MDM8084367.1 helix-turn-helix domain-containing protein [Cellulomonas cellasea]